MIIFLRARHFCLLALLVSLAGSPLHAQAPAGKKSVPRLREADLLVAAAASMKDVLTEIGKSYTRAHPNTKLRFNFGSSGTLQKQIEQGAPVDAFISAADKNMNELEKKKLIDKSSRRNIAGNALVLVAPRASRRAIHRFNDLGSSAIEHVAIGGPAVPAGMRAQEVFTKLGIWPQIRGKAVRGKDVREVLAHVELGNVEAGIVYATDAAASDKVRIVCAAPQSMHKPIRYPAAVVSDSKQAGEARRFVQYLSSASARRILRKYKFIVY